MGVAAEDRELRDADASTVFETLLPTLGRVLDLREVFHSISAVARAVIPHDEANLAVPADDGHQYRVFASTRDGAAHVVCPAGRPILRDPATPHLFEDEPLGPETDFRSGVSAPIVIDDRLVGVLALLARRPRAYSRAHLRLVERLAAYVGVAFAHQRLAESARRAAVERICAANLESSVELLRTLSNVLDIRAVFPRVSEIASRVIPHDRMAMVIVDDDDHVSFEAVSHDDFRALGALEPVFAPARDWRIVDDIEQERGGAGLERAIAAGYRSVLAVRTSARNQELALTFWSTRPHAFADQHGPAARRIADYVALAVSHEQLAHAAAAAAEARERAERLAAKVKLLADELDDRTGRARVVGESPGWQEVLRRAAQVAATDTTVLLTGESGTGKEVVARFIHRASPRASGRFVALNCAALPEQLLEAELFGYERGAFTGAQQSKPGQIEMAAGGVLLLDEVSEMSLAAQAKFLRVLQEREFQRLGGTRLLTANVRVIAATNRDLRKAVERGAFREDLYYRLQVFDIAIPPLRERRDDILPLSVAFLQDIGRSFGRPPAGLTRDGREALLAYHWPGNVRELRNALERAAILCDGGLITSRHLGLTVSRATPSTSDIGEIERHTIERVLAETRGNKSLAAKRLGLSRTQLYVRLRRHGIELPPA